MSDDWRNKMLDDIRKSIREAAPQAREERKWRKPSNPAGVPVWEHGGSSTPAWKPARAGRSTSSKAMKSTAKHSGR